MATYFNKNEPKVILLKSNKRYTDNEIDLSIDTAKIATKDDMNSLLAEIEFLNREINLLKRKIKRKSRKW